MKRQIARQGLHRLKSATPVILTIGFACAVFSNATSAEVYMWTDKDGTTHFSDVPSDSAPSQVIEVDGAPPPQSAGSNTPDPDDTDQLDTKPPSLAQQRLEQLAKDRADRRARQAELKKECATQQERLAKIEPARRVMYTNEQGEIVHMDDNQRMAIIDGAKEFIAKNCK